jgi:hypothetical protein
MFNCGCEVEFMGIDFNSNTGALHLSDGRFPDMLSTVQSFAAIHPDIDRIETFVDGVPDTVYLYIPAIKEWNAFPPTEAVFGEIK